MDIWKFYGITHREHVVCNPTSEEKLTRLTGLLRLPRGAPVVDIACGKAEFLIRLAEAYGVRGAGVDISPFFIEEARGRIADRVPSGDIELLQMDGADYEPEEPESFAMASCIGASWIFGGHANTLDALVRMVAPDGWVVVGEAFWLKEPSEEYLEASGETREMFGTHDGNARAGAERGLELLHTLVSSKDDWDNYEGLQWYSTSEYARAHPDDPDIAELTQRVAKQRATYLRWGRDTLGWAIYAFRRR